MGNPPNSTAPATPATPDAQRPDRPIGLTFAAEHGLVGNRAIIFATRNLPPPSELYITADDGLYITVTNIQAGMSINISAQILLPDGRLSSNLFSVQPPATATPTPYFFLLTEGYLFNVTTQPVPNLRRGATWISVAIRRGNISSGVTLQTLIQDYVDSFSGPTWPGGEIRHSTEGTGLFQTITVPAGPAGAAYVYTVPPNTRMRMRSIFGQYAASAAVATRTPYLWISDPSYNTIYQDVPEVTALASSTNSYTWAFGLGWAQTTLQQGALTRGAADVVLYPGCMINLTGFAMQAADTWKYIEITFEQWFSV